MAFTYDPKRVIVTFGGVPIFGFADGSFVSVTAANDRFTKKVGADGEVARVRGNDDTSEVTITLMATSPSNTYLSQILGVDRLTNLGQLPLQIVDLSGSVLFFWPLAWIKKAPDVEFSKEVGDRAWVFDTDQVVNENINGNLLPV